MSSLSILLTIILYQEILEVWLNKSSLILCSNFLFWKIITQSINNGEIRRKRAKYIYKLISANNIELLKSVFFKGTVHLFLNFFISVLNNMYNLNRWMSKQLNKVLVHVYTHPVTALIFCTCFPIFFSVLQFPSCS